MDAVAGSASSAFRPYLSDRLPTTGVSTSAPRPVTCNKFQKVNTVRRNGQVEHGQVSLGLRHAADMFRF